MSFRSRAQQFVFWGTALMVAAVAGGLWLAYSYMTDSDTLATLIRNEAPRYLANCRLVIGRVRVSPLTGNLNLKDMSLWQKVDGIDYLTLRVPWLDVQHDTQALWNGELLPREVLVAQPVLRLCRRNDGSWNLQGLMAEPCPITGLEHAPVIVIQNGTVQLSEGNEPAAAILREVSVRIEPTSQGLLKFEGSAKGDTFEHLVLKGTIDPTSGRVVLTAGELTRLQVSDTLRRRLPPELRPAVEKVGVTSGEIDLTLQHLVFDPMATPQFRYAVVGQLRGGMVECPHLPFSLSDVWASASVTDGILTIHRAEGYNGKTTVRAREGGTVDVADPMHGPMAMTLDVINLEFDDRLRAWTPAEFVPLWDEYQPRGWVNLAITVLRNQPGGPVGFGMRVDCLDVAIKYRYFPYPVEHIKGILKREGDLVTLELSTLSIGGKPFTAKGTIVNPGDDAIVQLDFDSEALPIDKALLEAMPADVRQVVDQFKPTGSVRGRAHLTRYPPGPGDPPEGKVTIDAFLDLNERCGILWEGLPYAITDLTGQLELHPDHWVFKNMVGRNGLARITGSGSVQQLGRGQLKTKLHLRGEHLPFDDQLRVALPPAWQATWSILRPSGSSTVDAQIDVEPGKESYRLAITPEHETRLQLSLPRVPGPGVLPGDTFDMPPMERITGSFLFDNGTVRMNDVSFWFRGSPAHFANGTVVVQDSGQFKLDVRDLEVSDFRIDDGLRKIMPPVMAQFARRIDAGHTFQFRTDLGIGWSGKPGESAWCSWSNALVVFSGNSIQTGLPLEHLQGQLDHLRGFFDGQNLEVHGALALDSVTLLGQQVTQLASPLDIARNRATLSDLRGILLGGELTGKVEVDLVTTPRYAAALAIRGADLQRYTKTLPGRQKLRGLVDGQIALSGLGNDLHNLQGEGNIRISHGDLGELPAFLRLVKVLNLSPMNRTAFDSAYGEFKIQNGETQFNPIKLTGNAFSLQGSGTLSVQGELNLSLRVLYGRDEGLHVPVLSDAFREASSQIFQIRVKGTPAYPIFQPVALQPASSVLQSLSNRRGGRVLPN